MPADAGRASAIDKGLRALGALLLAAYPACVYFALGRVSVRPLSLGLALVVATSLVLRLRGRKREHALALARIPVSVGALLLLGAWCDDRRLLLALPVLTNVVLLAQFAGSLRGIPMAERFARAQEDELSPAQVAYCRSVTIVWCVFFVINGGVTAVLALLAPVSVWAVYAGGISYGLVGLLAAGEYGVRKHRFRHVRGFELRPRADPPGSYDVHVPANLAYFQGHFHGDAILPGVVQVEVLVARQVATTWPELARICRVTRLRFKRPIRPGDDLVLQIHRPERERVDFDVRCGAEPCSSGTLHFEV
jgi:uncharacterized membrane protein